MLIIPIARMIKACGQLLALILICQPLVCEQALAVSNSLSVDAKASETATTTTADSATEKNPATAVVNSALSADGSEFLLPYGGRLTTDTTDGAFQDDSAKKGRKKHLTLEGGVEKVDLESEYRQRFDELVDAAITLYPKSQEVDKAVKHFSSKPAVLYKNVRDAVNYMVPYRAYSASTEAANVILDQKVKARSQASAEYIKQHLIDEVHPKIANSLMQIAMGMGTSDKARSQEMVNRGTEKLKQLVGSNETQKTVNMFKRWKSEIKVAPDIFSHQMWDVDDMQTKVKETTATAMDADPVMTKIIAKLNKYNHRSTLAKAARSTIESTFMLGTWVAPGILLPAALEVVCASYIMSSGGTTEDSLVKELYYDKRLESRWRTINEESQMAITHYQMAVLNKNPLLMACAESMLNQLVGEDKTQELLGNTVLVHHTGESSKSLASNNQGSATH